VFGPRSYEPPFEHKVFLPAEGQAFITVSLTLRNDRGSSRRFDFNRCVLDGEGGEIIAPLIVNDSSWTNHEGKHEVEIDPGETIARRLIFGYPAGRVPPRLSCVPMTLPLPLALGAGPAVAYVPTGPPAATGPPTATPNLADPYENAKLGLVFTTTRNAGFLLWGTSKRWYVIKGFRREKITRYDFYNLIERPELAEKQKFRDTLGNTLSWTGLGMMAGALVFAGWKHEHLSGLNLNIAAAGALGGMLLATVGGPLTAPLLTQDEAVEEVGHYNRMLKLRLRQGTDTGSAKQRHVGLRRSYAAAPWLAPRGGGMSLVAAW
jgi:hypothetical protein